MENRFENFTMLISKISRGIRKIKTEEMTEFNLKSSHVSIIYYLHKMGSLTAKELCDICVEDKGAVSRAIDYLEANACLACESSLKKRYNSRIMLTQKGNKIGQSIVSRIDGILENASCGLEEKDRIVLYKSLALISENLEKICNKYEG